MSFLDGWEEIEEYALAHTEPPTDVLKRLAAETRETMEAPQMMVGPLEGRFLQLLVRLASPRLVLELGTFTGYSSISMASALPGGGRIVTCDIDERAVAIARRYAEEAGVVDRIDYRLGPGLETIAGLDGPFDFVFIDADKESYVDYYEAVLPKLADDGLIVADNVLWSGRVVEPEPDETTRTIMEFNEHVRRDERVVAVMLTVRDGMTLIRRRPQG
ncbi:MAG TPA: O-methyltransferase [Gaiellaceae bacterium]|jgi:caffeoyl-CoA O-methyltransferase